MADGRMGDMLKGYYDALTATPPPERLRSLLEALEVALERGELRSGSLS